MHLCPHPHHTGTPQTLNSNPESTHLDTLAAQALPSSLCQTLLASQLLLIRNLLGLLRAGVPSGSRTRGGLGSLLLCDILQMDDLRDFGFQRGVLGLGFGGVKICCFGMCMPCDARCWNEGGGRRVERGKEKQEGFAIRFATWSLSRSSPVLWSQYFIDRKYLSFL